MRVTNTTRSSQNRLDAGSALFNIRFFRCYRLLHFLACRILDDPEQANKAVEKCWYSASALSPRFGYEGAFRSWLVRVLMDEALLLLARTKQPTLETKIEFETAGPRRSYMSVGESAAYRRG